MNGTQIYILSLTIIGAAVVSYAGYYLRYYSTIKAPELYAAMVATAGAGVLATIPLIFFNGGGNDQDIFFSSRAAFPIYIYYTFKVLLLTLNIATIVLGALVIAYIRRGVAAIPIAELNIYTATLVLIVYGIVSVIGLIAI